MAAIAVFESLIAEAGELAIDVRALERRAREASEKALADACATFLVDVALLEQQFPESAKTQ